MDVTPSEDLLVLKAYWCGSSSLRDVIFDVLGN